MRICSKCGDEKPLSEFATDRSKKDGIRGRCRACQRAYWNEWRSRPGNRDRVVAATKRSNQKHAASRRAYARRRTYGLTDAEFEAFQIFQAGRCAICSSPFDGEPCIDHDHESGAVRALLCRRCNSGLGMFNDDPSTLLEASRYVASHRKVDAHVA